MQQRWSLQIEDFGKIGRGVIEISPMMLFVGDNNSGKSYVMSLLWGILHQSHRWLHSKPIESEAFENCDQWLLKAIRSGSEAKLTADVQDLFVQWFNDLLKRNKNKVVESVFNYDLKIGNVFVDQYRRAGNLTLSFDTTGGSFKYSRNKMTFPIHESTLESRIERMKILRTICWKLLLEGLSRPVLPALRLSKKGESGEPLYLPASRTGFMLTYKTLLHNVIEREFGMESEEETYRSMFTLPVTSFLQDLVNLSEKDRPEYSDICRFIETEIMKGTVVKDQLPVSNITFKPEGLRTDIPLHVTSSLVAELTPIILFLKARRKFNVMMIEEPEAHLHLKAQVNIARALIRLHNTGLPVWFTTHSDTIFQQINNMIKLSRHADARGELGYSEQDLLDPNSVNAYQFSTMPSGGTRIDKLEPTHEGFAVPTFNETIFKLTKETIALQEREDDT